MGTQSSTVKWFDAKKGYGFIDHPDGGNDVFVHYTQIVSDQDFKTLRTGQAVEFEMENGPKGLHALKVNPEEEEAWTEEGEPSPAEHDASGAAPQPAGDRAALEAEADLAEEDAANGNGMRAAPAEASRRDAASPPGSPSEEDAPPAGSSSEDSFSLP